MEVPMSTRSLVALPLAAATMLSLYALPAVAAEAEAPRATAAKSPRLFLETDPATFVFEGFAAHARLHVDGFDRWTLGVGAYALNLPSLLVELDPANRDEGWSSRITAAGSLFVDRFFRNDAEGAFVGVQLGLQRFRVTRKGSAGEAGFTNLIAMPRVGYVWRPFDAGFYVMPWVGLGATARIEGDLDVGGESYHLLPVIAFATVHTGWSF
jgi:hypothetical protein